MPPKTLRTTLLFSHLPVALTTLALVITLFITISCNQPPAVQPVPINTVFTANNPPTTQVANALGFRFPPAKDGRLAADVRLENAGCTSCHQSDSHTMHVTSVTISCVDCHGGRHDAVKLPDALQAMFVGKPDAEAEKGYATAMEAQQAAFTQLKSAQPAKYDALKNASHVQPKLKELWPESGANPQIAGVATTLESPDFIRFVNPGDLRAAQVACAACHAEQVRTVPTSMMAHGAMLWNAAFYNNGSTNNKSGTFGEGYAPDGSPARILPTTVPTTRQVERNGMLVELWPIMRWEVSQPGNILRVFERGAKNRPQIALPNPVGEGDPGRPDVKLSLRGFGTDVRTDPVNIGLQKTRLLDPTLNLLGTNDHPGDYRSSGCTACHVVYANDRNPIHSERWSKFGNQGKSFSTDPTVNPGKNQPTTQPSGTVASAPMNLSSEGGLSVGRVHVNQHNTDSAHPVEHRFVRAMPTSTCIVCHIHPGTNVLNSYLGYMWWDNESDAKHMYPGKQRYPTPEDEFKTQIHNPEGSAVRGLWSDPAFLQQLGTKEFNSKLERVQFADFHGHGWVFRAVFKQDRHGNLLDAYNKPVDNPTAEKLAAGVNYTWDENRKDDDDKKLREGTPVHLKDIHLEKGMQCVDCHFSQDNHGDGNLYGETRNAVMVECIDCHGGVDRESNILAYLKDTRARNADDFVRDAFTGNAAPKNLIPDQLTARRNFLSKRFEEDGGRLRQKSALDPKKGWYVSQTSKLSPTSASPGEKLGAYAHTVRRDNKTWGTVPTKDDEGKPDLQLAHASSTMSCYACHSSWNTSCFGCHLPQRANQRKPMLHNEGAITRNYTNYNYQTLRDDVYMLGVDSSVKGNKIVPIRSACAVLVSSQDAQRQWIYSQQQTVSAEGFAGTAFSPYFPHTVRATETKQCADCHISKDANGQVDNNAIMAQLLLQGTNSVNFIGRWAWVAEQGGGLEAVAVTEQTEPQAVIGSTLHKWAYPDFYNAHQRRGQELQEHHHHDGTVLDLQLRGEYLYAACGKDGFIAYDVANIENKGFSERIITAPVSPLGQRFYVRSKYATSITSPSTLAIDPTRDRDPANKEGPIHPLYAFLYLTDAQEGLIVIGGADKKKPGGGGVATLLDGDPDNNFLDRALTYNPNNLLKGAKHLALHGHHAYVSCDAGLVVLDLDNPLQPRHVTTLTNFTNPRKVAFQFRYAFVLDDKGLHVLDVTDINNPLTPSPKAATGPSSPNGATAVGEGRGEGSFVPLADARDIYLSRTYAYIAGGNQGLHIVDIERPQSPKLIQTYNADGKLNDTTAVRTGMTNASMFAYVADGRNGLYVLQLTSPDDSPTYGGFSPQPNPRLIAHHKTRGPAVAISEGLDRDRAVDEAGYQLAVFGRKGARPFNKQEQQRLYLKDNQLYTVTNTPTTDPLKPAGATEAPPPTTIEPPKRPGGIPRRKP